jgi:hypothetical protein
MKGLQVAILAGVVAVAAGWGLGGVAPGVSALPAVASAHPQAAPAPAPCSSSPGMVALPLPAT